MDEQLSKVYDSLFNVIGAEPREKIHKEGLLHQAVHLWMGDIVDGERWLYFRRRSNNRHIAPGLYDIIATHHVDPDGTFEEAISNNIQTFLGMNLSIDDLTHIGNVRHDIIIGDYHDNALCQIYFANVDKPEFNGDEKASVIKVRLSDYEAWISGNTDSLLIYDRFGEPLGKTTKEDWWLREKEYFTVVKMYFAREDK